MTTIPLVSVLLGVAGLAACAQPEPLTPPRRDETAEALDDGRFLERSYTGEHGTRAYKLYLPSGYDRSRPVPLVVMLHGCTQDADDFAAGTRMNELAEEGNFLVAYPEQPPEANANTCWNWYEPAHQKRGRGEPSLIAGITEAVMAEHKVDRRRIYLAGISAGGAMGVLTAAAYPELYAAIGSHSALEYRAATNLAEALAAMAAGGPDPRVQGAAAHAAMGERARVMPTIVFHGALDPTVNVVNAHQTLSQWAASNDLSEDGVADGSIGDAPSEETEGETPAGYHYTRSLYRDGSGNVIMEKWIVHEMTHRWSGGSSAGTYTDPRGPDASREMVRFFLEHRIRED